MGERVSFSGQRLELPEIATHHNDLASSLSQYFHLETTSHQLRFWGYTRDEIVEELRDRLDEVDLTSSLAVLAAVEIAFRIDYLQRCYKRQKDDVSWVFRAIHKAKKEDASLDQDIFGTWARNSSVPGRIIGELRGAFRFRHWLAHGRYWTPKLGRPSDFTDVFALADLTIRSFPFLLS